MHRSNIMQYRAPVVDSGSDTSSSFSHEDLHLNLDYWQNEETEHVPSSVGDGSFTNVYSFRQRLRENAHQKIIDFNRNLQWEGNRSCEPPLCWNILCPHRHSCGHPCDTNPENDMKNVLSSDKSLKRSASDKTVFVSDGEGLFQMSQADLRCLKHQRGNNVFVADKNKIACLSHSDFRCLKHQWQKLPNTPRVQEEPEQTVHILEQSAIVQDMNVKPRVKEVKLNIVQGPKPAADGKGNPSKQKLKGILKMPPKTTGLRYGKIRPSMRTTAKMIKNEVDVPIRTFHPLHVKFLNELTLLGGENSFKKLKSPLSVPSPSRYLEQRMPLPLTETDRKFDDLISTITDELQKLNLEDESEIEATSTEEPGSNISIDDPTENDEDNENTSSISIYVDAPETIDIETTTVEPLEQFAQSEDEQDFSERESDVECFSQATVEQPKWQLDANAAAESIEKNGIIDSSGKVLKSNKDLDDPVDGDNHVVCEEENGPVDYEEDNGTVDHEEGDSEDNEGEDSVGHEEDDSHVCNTQSDSYVDNRDRKDGDDILDFKKDEDMIDYKVKDNTLGYKEDNTCEIGSTASTSSTGSSSVNSAKLKAIEEPDKPQIEIYQDNPVSNQDGPHPSTVDAEHEKSDESSNHSDGSLHSNMKSSEMTATNDNNVHQQKAEPPSNTTDNQNKSGSLPSSDNKTSSFSDSNTTFQTFTSKDSTESFCSTSSTTSSKRRYPRASKIPVASFKQPLTIHFFDERVRKPSSVMLFMQDGSQKATEAARQTTRMSTWEKLVRQSQSLRLPGLRGLLNPPKPRRRPVGISYRRRRTEKRVQVHRCNSDLYIPKKRRYATVTLQSNLIIKEKMKVEQFISDDFMRKFRSFAKCNDSRRSGIVISKTRSCLWQRKAGLYDGMVEPDYAVDYFNYFTGRKVVLNAYDYMYYLARMARYKNIEVEEVVSRMSMCSTPEQRKHQQAQQEKYEELSKTAKSCDENDKTNGSGIIHMFPGLNRKIWT